VNAGYTKIKVIGAWDSGKAPCFKRDYNDTQQINTSITSINLGDVTGLTYIPDNICTSVSNLKKVILPDGVETIGSYAFANCNSLEYINLPNTIKEIKGYCFNKCILKSLTSLPKSLETIGNYAFASSDICFSALPENVQNIGMAVFYFSTFRTDSFEWPESITKIPDLTFAGSINLNLVIPSSVTEIGGEAFECNENLNIKCLAEKVPELGTSAFYNYSGVTYNLYVPLSSLDAYKEAWGSYFKSISAIE
jgi:hypothetical protein